MKHSAPKIKGVVPFKERLSFWCYGGGMLVFYQIVASYMNTFILMQGVDMAKVALVILLVKVWDAVNDPMFAFVFDRIKFNKEKCLPWLRIAAILMPIASIAFFNMPHDWDETGKLIWFAVTYVLWDACFTISDIPYYSMTTTMTTDMHERDTLFSVARVFNGGGYLIVNTMMTWLIGENCGLDFGMASIITCAVGLPFVIPLCFIGRERYAVKEDKPEEKYTLKQMWTYLKGNKYLLIMYSCQVLSGLLNTSAAAGLMGTYYFFGETDFSILNMWMGMLPGPIIGMLLPKLLQKFDRFKLYMFCVIWVFAWNFIGVFSFPLGFLTVEWVYFTTLVTGVFNTTRSMMAYSFTLDTLEYGRYKTGIDGTGINFAIQTLSTKVPGSIGDALGVWLLSMTSVVIVEANSIAELAASGVQQTHQALLEMHFVTTIPGLISSAASIILLLCFYKLRTKDAAIMAKYNAGEITREECDAQLSRKY